MRRDKSEYAVQAVNNAIDILEFLGEADGELSISEVGSKLGLTKNNVNKLLATLESFGYVEFNRYTGNFRLGVKTFQISQAYINKLNLIEISVQILNQVKDKINESVYISVLRGGNIVYLNLVETDMAVRVLPRIGNVGPAYATATGKAQIAYLPESELNKLYPEKLEKVTENTIDNLDDLKKELEIVRERGYALDNEEYEIGVRCLGAPIRDFMGNVIAGISISAPIERLPDERLFNEVADAVLDASKELSIKFGYNFK
jgi:DNA-binding IclR family transcriptional regulator